MEGSSAQVFDVPFNRTRWLVMEKDEDWHFKSFAPQNTASFFSAFVFRFFCKFKEHHAGFFESKLSLSKENKRLEKVVRRFEC